MAMLGGPTVVMLSAVDGPPGASALDQVWQPCMVRGDHPRLPHLVRGTIGSVTGHAASVKITCRNNVTPYIELTIAKHSRKKSRGTGVLLKLRIPRKFSLGNLPPFMVLYSRDYKFGDQVKFAKPPN